MKCRKVWSNKAYFEYERNWEKLTWNIKQSYSGLFPIWIGLHQRWIPQCNAWAGGYSRYFAATGEFLSFLQRCWKFQFQLGIIASPRYEIFSLTKFLLLKTVIFQTMMMIITRGSSLIDVWLKSGRGVEVRINMSSTLFLKFLNI